MFEKKIITWENLAKRGLIGPSRCILCGEKEETMNHLFFECQLSKYIWSLIVKEVKIDNCWEGGQIIECF
jgi:hypothetical protein